MSDDAEFDAFLNGQGDLARSLQGLAQPGPSAALDAAILANARAALAQEARPQAANDSGAAAPAPQLARSLGWRWRIPAGIAAAVLVGVFAQRNFEANPDLNDLSAPVMMQESSPVPAAEMPSPPPPPAPATDERRMEAVANSTPAPVPQAVARAKPRPEQPAPAQEAQQELARKATARQVQPVEKSSADSAVQAEAAPEVSTNHFGRNDKAYGYSPAPAPAPAPAAAPPIAAAAATEQVEVSARRRQLNDASGQIASSAAPPNPQLTARAWLDRIENALAEGRRDEAVADWKAFRKAHPAYPVPDTTRSKLE